MTMRKITIEHVIRNSADEKELFNQLKCSDLRSAMWDYSQWLRAVIKYGDENLTPEEVNGVEKARESFCQFLSDNNINLDD